ncbi:hypothetical protein Ancab_022380 [Ancistrocladus abbreviatus]
MSSFFICSPHLTHHLVHDLPRPKWLWQAGFPIDQLGYVQLDQNQFRPDMAYHDYCEIGIKGRDISEREREVESISNCFGGCRVGVLVTRREWPSEGSGEIYWIWRPSPTMASAEVAQYNGGAGVT